jgi:beta-1,4-mannosyl-glycoprotein beta-1,4-N-acetylglucosaminyltransferase
MKVIDCFLFFNEFLILDIRLKELYDVVDKFVIVESHETFTGRAKPLYLLHYLEERYPQYKDKIEIIVPDVIETDNLIKRQQFQEDHINKKSLEFLNLSEDDIILLSDADEIPKRETIEKIKSDADESPCMFFYNLYYYKLNNLVEKNIVGTTAYRYRDFTTRSNARLNYIGMRAYADAGWHFAYLMTPDKIKNKIHSFCYQQYNTNYFTNESRIKQKIENKLDLFDRPHIKIQTVDLDDNCPIYVKTNFSELEPWISDYKSQKKPKIKQKDLSCRLDEFKKAFDECGSDKSYAHNYHMSYAELIPFSVKNMLEIGLTFDNNLGKGSLLAWSNLFPKAKIIGADIDDRKFIKSENVKCYWIDQTSENSLVAFKKCLNLKFDLIIDDGTHFFKDASLTFDNLFPLLEEHGIYCVEDIVQSPNGWQQTVEDWVNHLSKKGDVFFTFRNTSSENDNSIICFISRQPLEKQV